MKVNEQTRIKLQDFVAKASAHKDKQAAIQAAIISLGDSVSDGDVSILCSMFRLPVSWGSDIRRAILVAQKLKELEPVKAPVK